MTEVTREDRQRVADAHWGGSTWRSHPQGVGLRSWSDGSGPAVISVHYRHAEQYAQLRERAEKAESERDEALAVRDGTYDDYKAQHAEAISIGVRCDELRDKLDKTLRELESKKDQLSDMSLHLSAAESELARMNDRHVIDRRELEALRVKSTPSAQAVEWVRLYRGNLVSPGLEAVYDFVLSLAPEKPKRKTRLDAAMAAFDACTGPLVQHEDLLRDALKAAGVDPDEELPEGVNA